MEHSIVLIFPINNIDDIALDYYTTSQQQNPGQSPEDGMDLIYLEVYELAKNLEGIYRAMY